MSTNPMRKMVLTSFVCWLGASPALALAHHPSALVSIRNQFDGKGEVYINGRFQGVVPGNATASFPAQPGRVTVSVQRPGTHFVLAEAALHTSPGATAWLPVEPPRGAVKVTNAGEIAIKVKGDRQTLWIQPGRTALVNVEAGNVSLNASVVDPRGEWVALERTVWVEPGQIGTTTLRPDPTVLIVTNYERYPVRAMVDGKEIGWVTPGDTQRTWVRPGPAQVVLLDRYGRVRSTTSVVVRKGSEARVVLNGQGPVRPPPVVGAPVPPYGGAVVDASWSPGRPGGPVREHRDGDGCEGDRHDDHDRGWRDRDDDRDWHDRDRDRHGRHDHDD